MLLLLQKVSEKERARASVVECMGTFHFYGFKIVRVFCVCRLRCQFRLDLMPTIGTEKFAALLCVCLSV